MLLASFKPCEIASWISFAGVRNSVPVALSRGRWLPAR